METQEEQEEEVQEPLDTVVKSDSDSEQEESDIEEQEEYKPVSESSSESSDVSSDSGEGETAEATGWTSRSGEIQWAPTNTDTQRYTPVPTGMVQGPTRYATARISSLVDSFNLYITDDILKLITDHTNLKGRRKIANWKDIDATDLRAYIGLLLLAGVYRSRHESTLSLWDDHTGRAIFRATMSQDTFRLINTCLRFEDRLSRSQRLKENKLAAFRDIWEMWTTRLPLLYNPGKDVCVDEQLVPFRGRCSFRQYIPKKPAKYGIKVWVTCDVDTSYAWRMSIYTGKQAGAPPEKQQGKRVVLEMTEGLRGVTVTCDNFFTSFALAEELLQRKVALVGTIRHNKPELPPQLLQVKGRAVLSSMFAFTRTHTAVSYVPKRGKNVLLISTKHREAVVSSEEKKKPQIICDYNHCKGGVDNLDKVVGTYTCRRRTNWWPLVLFFNLLDVSAYNAFILWTTIDPSWQRGKTYRRRLFIEELGTTLVTEQMARRHHLPRTPGAAALVLDAQRKAGPSANASPSQHTPQKRKQCVLCTSKRQVFTTCSKCGGHICKEHYQPVCNPCLT